MKRDGTRELLKPFDTKGITPAAGLTSNVEDLARFASWQLRLLRTGKEGTEDERKGKNVLKASTLREMQRVQYVDPGWKVTYGLGFSIDRKDKNTFVGHEGDCPGYATSVRLRTEDELAVVLMKDAPPDALPLTETVFAIFDKRKGYEFKEPPPARGVDLEAYSGHYSNQPWGSESVMVPWAGGLAYLTLPASDPAGSVSFLKPKGGDVFRRVREDGSEAEEVKFLRDASGKVTGFMHFSNPTMRQPDTR
jgi:CubicO group peptidase (beta-lactamase class C family)